MKFVVALSVISFVALVYANHDVYTSKYNNINVDEILHSERLLLNYIHCLLGKGTCSKEGQELKRILSEALQTKCAKCSELQKQQSIKVIQYLIKNKKSLWDELEAVYDPSRNYRKVYEKEIKDAGIEF